MVFISCCRLHDDTNFPSAVSVVSADLDQPLGIPFQTSVSQRNGHFVLGVFRAKKQTCAVGFDLC